MKCPICKCEKVNFIETPKLLHYGKEECAKCGRFIKWVKTPKRSDKEAKPMKIREDFEKILDDCEARYAVNSPVKGRDWHELTLDDFWFLLGGESSGLLGAQTPAERYAASLDCILVLLMLASKAREGLSWDELGIEVFRQPKDPEVLPKECEEMP